MDLWEWLVGATLFAFYIVCLFTVCRLTFEKGHTILGNVGIFMAFFLADRGDHSNQAWFALRCRSAEPIPVLRASK